MKNHGQVDDVTVADIFGTMESRVRPEGVEGVEANYGYVVTGNGGGEWTVMVHGGAVEVREGIHDPGVNVTVAAEDWIAVTLGTLDAMTAFTSGKVKVEGNMQLMMLAPKLFRKYEPPRPAPVVTVADIFGTMESRVRPEGVAGVEANYGYVVTGSGGGEWTVMVHGGALEVREGIHDPDVKTTVAAEDWIAVTLGTLDAMAAFTSGKVKVEGNIGLMSKAARFFEKYQPPLDDDDEEEQEELIVLKQIIEVPQRFATGPVMGKFLNALKQKKILASRCPSCGKHLLPAREACADCVVAATDWVEVGPEGMLTMWDVTFYASPDPLSGEARETPYVSAHFLLDGCTGHETFWHELNADQIPLLRKGARVRPVWNDERRGAITDIRYFEITD